MKDARVVLMLSVIVLIAGFRGTWAQEDAPPPIEPPVLTGGAEDYETAFTVSITAAGELLLDGEAADWSALETVLCARKRQKGMIRINADKGAPWAVVRNASFMIGEAPYAPSPLWAVKTEEGDLGWHQPVIPGSMHKARKAFWVKVTPSAEGVELTCMDGSLGVLPPSGKSKSIRSTLSEFQEWEPDKAAKIIGGVGVDFGEITSVSAVLTRSGYKEVLYEREPLPLEFPPERPMEGTSGELRTAEEIRESLALPDAETETTPIDDLMGAVEVIVTATREILVDGTRSDRDFIVQYVGDKAEGKPEGGDRITRSGQELSARAVRLLADRNAHWRDVQEVIDSCREVGVHRIHWTVQTPEGPALAPVFLNLEDTRKKDRAAKPIRFTLRLKRSCGQDRTFVNFSEVEMGPLPRCIAKIGRELPQWRVEEKPLFGTVEAWGCVPFQDVVSVVIAIKSKVDRLSVRPAPGWDWD